MDQASTMELGYMQVQTWHQGTTFSECDFRHKLYILENHLSVLEDLGLNPSVSQFSYVFSMCPITSFLCVRELFRLWSP